MTNLLIMLAPILAYYLIPPYFYLVLCSAITVCRFRFNESKIILGFSVIGTLLTNIGILFYIVFDPFVFILGFQIMAGLVGFAYSIKKRLWKRDIVFVFLEPAFIFIASGYFLRDFPFSTIMDNIFSWMSFFILIQILLILVKVVAAYRLSNVAKTAYERLMLIFSYLPHVKPSFGLQDFSVSTGVSYFYQPTHLDNVMNELKFAENMIFAEMSGKVSEKEKLKKEREKLIGDATGFSRFMKSLSN